MGLAEPEKKFGDSVPLDSFIKHIRFKYEMEAGRFPSERTKILHCLSCMGGAAYEFHCNADCCQTFDKLAEELTLMFNPPSLRHIVASRQFSLNQEARSVFAYVVEFCTVAAKLDHPE